MLHGLGATEESRRPMGRPQIPEVNIPPQAAGGDAPNVSPEEQDLYDRAVGLFVLGLYDEKMMPKTLKLFEQIGDPIDGVSEVTSQIGMRVYAKAKEDGVDIPGDIWLHAADDMVDQTIEFLEDRGVAKLTPEQTERAFYATADKFGQAAREMGIYSDEQAQADKTELDRMADSGALNEFLQRAGQQGGLG